MSARLTRRVFPPGYRGANIVHPWTVLGFVAGAAALGVAGGPNRTPGTWLGLGAGTLTSVGVTIALWFLLRRRLPARGVTALAVAGLAVSSGLGSFVTLVSVPVETFTVPARDLTAAAMAFVWFCQALVWFFLWVLSGILVTGQRSYRLARAELWSSTIRIATLREQANEYSVDVLRAKKDAVVTGLNQCARRLSRHATSGTSLPSTAFLDIVTTVQDTILEPTLLWLKASTTPLSSVTPSEVKRSSRRFLKHVPRRWQGVYFSGLVGALLICVVAITAGTSPNLGDAGLLVQIPLVGLAFLISVPSALLLFFASTLTPFLTTGQPDASSVTFMVIILALALASFAHRANEVRQSRVLESLSRSVAQQALDLVTSQQTLHTESRALVRVLHGRLQGTLTALRIRESSTPEIPSELAQELAKSFSDIANELSEQPAASEPSPTFAASLEHILGLWEGVMEVSVDIDDTAEALLARDIPAAAVTIDLLTEATTNAAKYSEDTALSVRITSDGDTLHIVATSGQPKTGRPSLSGTRLGLDYLRNVTSNLRLESDGRTMRLIADIPVRERSVTQKSVLREELTG